MSSVADVYGEGTKEMKGLRLLVSDARKSPFTFSVLILGIAFAIIVLTQMYNDIKERNYHPFANYSLEAVTDGEVVTFTQSGTKLVDANLISCTASWQIGIAVTPTAIYDAAGEPKTCATGVRGGEYFITQPFRVLVPAAVEGAPESTILRLCWGYEGYPTWCYEIGYMDIRKATYINGAYPGVGSTGLLSVGEPRSISPMY